MRLMKRVLIAILLLAAALYICDYASIRYRLSKNHSPLGTVQIQRYYAVREKDRKTEFMFAEPETQTCVHSLFPHLGYRPCWYVGRRNVKRIDA